MVEADGAFQTQDLTLAVILASSSFEYRLGKVDQRCMWTFVPNIDRDEELDALVFAYAQHGLKVEPRRFVADMARMREEMYRFLGIGDRRRKPIAPSAQTA